MCVLLCMWVMVDDGWEYGMDGKAGWIDTYDDDSKSMRQKYEDDCYFKSSNTCM